jgi:heme O synthase-like polyprenyltransferase
VKGCDAFTKASDDQALSVNEDCASVTTHTGMLVMTLILLGPVLEFFVMSAWCLIIWKRGWRIASAVLLTIGLILVALHFVPVPNNIWPLSLFFYGCILLCTIVVLLIVKSVIEAAHKPVMPRDRML